ncbi:MAG: hypothetical protein CL819_09860 [Croceicoccus sp.]|nr:hypothetical protein [Croceicoccus sp.]
MGQGLLRRLLLGLVLLVGAGLLWAGLVRVGVFGRVLDGGVVMGPSAPAADGRAPDPARAEGPGAEPGKQILFGDLHAHTSFSSDAFLWSLPLLQGDGAHPPADACHFARFCSGLDFWSINDHAESLTPERWRETIRAIRACNEAAGDPSNPDLVSFLGWEWTQVGATPAQHYGHKNVVLLNDDPRSVPVRPIAAGGENLRTIRSSQPGWLTVGLALLDFPNRQAYYDFDRFQRDTGAAPLCGSDLAVERDCVDVAATPDELFAKLEAWGGEALVIPHGTSWGATTPPGVSWDGQLRGRSHDPERQRLIEVYSGHGSSEEYRGWRAGDEEGACPPPHDDYLPVCWRAGEIIRERCRAQGGTGEECEERAAVARTQAVAAGRNAVLTIPGQRGSDWGDAEQCRDCFLPAFAYRPGKSAQAALATRGPAGEAFRFGLIASSDNHSARPGTGYKEFGRVGTTDQRALVHGTALRLLERLRPEPVARSRAVAAAEPGVGTANAERQASFWTSGGLVAVHARGRSRAAIWSALERREVYGTSGPRILLWFELLTGPGDPPVPMGAEVAVAGPPRFRVRAVGSAHALPGCPEASTSALGAEELERLCLGECHHPGETRRPIIAVEVVRIRPQAMPGQALGERIEDPWKTLPCPGEPEGCVVEFSDPGFDPAQGETLYYVRALEAPSPAINGGGLRCVAGGKGPCETMEPCLGGLATPPGDDCLAAVSQRAWSSPIFVRPAPLEGASP